MAKKLESDPKALRRLLRQVTREREQLIESVDEARRERDTAEFALKYEQKAHEKTRAEAEALRRVTNVLQAKVDESRISLRIVVGKEIA